jgi:stage V sporulation protein D (sporulation-specific penicillin-binding protein)
MRKKKSAVHITTLPHRIRIVIIFIFFSLAFLSVICRLYHLQFLNHEKYNKEAEQQHHKDVKLSAKRGAIFDRNGNELAVSIDLFDVVCSPNAIAQVKYSKDKWKKNIDVKLAEELAPILEQSGKSLLTSFTSDTKARRIVIAKGIDIISHDKVNAVLMKYRVRNEAILEPVSKRFYPKKELACHVIGPVGIGYDDTTNNVHQENLGLGGAEQNQQKNISGTNTKTVCLQDNKGRVLTPLDYTSLLSVEGNQLYLTIDETIQHAAEQVLHETVEKNKATGGSVIVMDPFTGEILALANAPNFDLNRYREIARNREVWRRVSRNEAIEGVIEPGSTAKIFTAAAALEEKTVKLTDKFYGYKGKVVFCNRILRDSHPYEWLTFPEVIEVSSNIGIHQVAQRMSPTNLRHYFTQFGFGSRSEIELPGEAYGLVPSLKQWTPLTMSRISFGQSISMSPLQLTCAVAAIANGGMLMKPHIVKAVYDAQGRKIKETSPEPVRRVISDLTAKTLSAIMEGVVERGTGKMAQMKLYRVAGKTGTAQVVLENARGYKRGKYNSSFVGFVPAEAPRVVITVIINEPSGGLYFGGTVAAPVFKKVAEEALTQLGVHPSLAPLLNSDSSQIVAQVEQESTPAVDKGKVQNTLLLVSNPQGNPRTVLPAPNSAVQMVSYAGESSAIGWKPAPLLMPDVRGLTKRKVAYLLSPYKISMQFIGSGVAVGQTPAPGNEIKFGTTCVICFSANGKN